MEAVQPKCTDSPPGIFERLPLSLRYRVLAQIDPPILQSGLVILPHIFQAMDRNLALRHRYLARRKHCREVERRWRSIRISVELRNILKLVR